MVEMEPQVQQLPPGLVQTGVLPAEVGMAVHLHSVELQVVQSVQEEVRMQPRYSHTTYSLCVDSPHGLLAYGHDTEQTVDLAVQVVVVVDHEEERASPEELAVEEGAAARQEASYSYSLSTSLRITPMFSSAQLVAMEEMEGMAAQEQIMVHPGVVEEVEEVQELVDQEE